MNCIKKNNIKIYIKTATEMFRCYSYTIIRESINLCVLKLQLLKQSIKIHRCVVNTMVMVWLCILGPYWCLCVALFGSSNTVVVWLHILGPYWCLCVALCRQETLTSKYCRSCFNINFNVNFNTFFLRQVNGALFGE